MGSKKSEAAETIHLWIVDQVSSQRFDYFKSLLSSDETTRSSKFHFAVDQYRYVLSRGLLRAQLGKVLDTQPHELVFDYSTNGKPSISRGSHREAPQFNVSHCRDMTLIAITGRRRVGVDIERVRHVRDFEHIAERHFTDAEQDFLQRTPNEEKHRAFLMLWTRKEAWAKALGLNLSAALSATPFPPFPKGESETFCYTNEHNADTLWHVSDLNPGDHHVGSICIQGEPAGVIVHLHDEIP